MLNFLTKKNKGFTLIELLVVIAIIGVLSGIVIVAVGDATARARDSRRLADVRQLAFVLERETALGPAVVLTCAAAVSTTACAIASPPDRPAVGRYFSAIVDPGAVGAIACPTGAAPGTGPCHYSIHSDPGITPVTIHTNNYSICFWLETDVAGPLVQGLNSIRTGARMASGVCP